ncbi:MAG: nucleotide sugar dehydrogenase [bacterium]|nr:nucleotide sugar dehydrogenase [bacterium]
MKVTKKAIKNSINNKKKLVNNNKAVSIVGLGYVGLPLAALCVEKGYKVYGVAKGKKKLNMINKGINPLTDEERITNTIAKKKIIASTKFDSVKKSDIIIICVPTPVDEFYNPDLTPIKSATKSVGNFLKRGQLVIVESTINPGVCEEVVKPILEEVSGMEAGKDFYLAHCPERINPGDPKWNVTNIPRVVGALSAKGLQLAMAFYKSILDAPVRGMKSIKEAEASKIIENSFRDINIAFVNELAKSFDKLGIDLYDVIQGAATKPFAFMPHWPSVGVGGHCIPVDPYYLIERARLAGFDHKFLKLAREINNSMPKYTVGILTAELNKLGKSVFNTDIGILGLSYKANVADMRETPSKKVIKILKERGAKVHLFDPYFKEQSTVKSLEELLKKSFAVVVVTNHREFVEMDLKKLKNNGVKIIIDGKNCLDKEKIKKLGLVYKGIGR